MHTWKLQIAVLVGFALGQPSDDDCLNATAVTDGLYQGDTTDATIETDLTRNYSPCTSYFNDIWYSYSATCTGIASVIATGDCDLVLATWRGTCDSFPSHQCVDESGTTSSETLFFAVEQDESYFVTVADYLASCMGPVSLNFTCSPLPPYSDCQTAYPVYDGLQTSLSNVGATTASVTTNPCPSYYHDVWFVYNATCSGRTNVTISNSRADLQVVLWGGQHCDSLTGLVCGDTGNAGQPDHVIFATEEGLLYYLSVAGYENFDVNEFEMNVQCVPTPPAPVNDECSGAISIADGEFVQSSLFGASHSTQATSCTSHGDLWFTYAAPCTGTATIIVTPRCATDQIALQMWEGPNCSAVVPRACRDTAAFSETTVFLTETGKDYYFLVGSKTAHPYDDDFTISTMCVQSQPPPANDVCSGAYWVVDGPNNAANAGATKDDVDSGCVDIHSDVWFRYKANCTGTATATLNTPQDLVLVAWEGDNCSSLTSTQCAHNASVHFSTVNGSSYYLSAGGFDVYQGPLLLTLSCQPAGPTTSAPPTHAPTRVPQTGDNNCPDFQPFLVNCSAKNFTADAQCSEKCAQVSRSIFEGSNLNTSRRVACLSVVNQTWSSPEATAVLVQRVVAGSPLCRSGAFQLMWAWVPLVIGLLLA